MSDTDVQTQVNLIEISRQLAQINETLSKIARALDAINRNLAMRDGP